MLELKNIVKDYVSGNNVTHALKGISINFRKNEFVSILGASGCGKTTTLNIIGGLDRYTSGDLKINGKSTKKYNDRDWDTYRNHSVGFIFQSYNLISHQSILKNVELALTISGVNKKERTERAYQALEKVGLKGMEKKKPNQLSGGQCQRVAIARALINNPEILLADEPTGALDSETSVQIMDLLKEVAKDRLVIMVTHNPDLAKKYSTRIVTMSDGILLNDTKPFNGKEKKIEIDKNKGKKKKSSMSIFTAAGLSISNLFSKMRRTVLVTIAGSIGIIGVSAVLAVSQGVKDYIGDLQNDMLSSYPLTIAEESVDYTSLMTGLDNSEIVREVEFDPENPKMSIDSMIDYLMTAYSGLTKIKTNTITTDFVSYLADLPEDATAAKLLNYGIDPTNNIFTTWVNEEGENEVVSFNGLTQRYIAELMTLEGFSTYASYVDLFTDFMHEMPDNEDYIKQQYDTLGENPFNMNENELVLVVDDDVSMTDLLLAQTGILDHDSFISIAEYAVAKNEGDVERMEELKDKRPSEVDFSKILNREFYYYPQDTIYEYSNNVAPDTIDVSVSFDVKNNGDTICLFSGNYQSLFGLNVINGTAFMKENNNYVSKKVICLSFGSTPSETIDETSTNGVWLALDATSILSSGIQNMSPEEQIEYVLNNALFGFALNKNDFYPVYKYFDNVQDIIDNIENPMALFGPGLGININPNIVATPTPVTGFTTYCTEQAGWRRTLDQPNSKAITLKIGSILKLKKSKNFGCLSRGLYYSKDFMDKFVNDSKDGALTNALKDHMSNSTTRFSEFKAYTKFKYWDHRKDEDGENHEVAHFNENGYASSLNGDLSTSFSDLFSGITGVNYEETNAVHLRSICGYKAIIPEDPTDEVTFDYVPKKISIYPKSFEAKDVIKDYLLVWNDGTHDELSVTDTIQLIITVVNTLIEAITIALVAFSSLSLVVSCFMIAVITYISVVERIKEIGVIRSLGGRKGDVANLFIMETLFTGLFSGAFGIAITYIFQIIFNAALTSAFGIAIANLTPLTAIIMILVSVTLSVVSGLIPSQSAAHKDPVVALRTAE